MPEIVRTCPLCSNDCSDPFDRRSFRGREVTNRVCLDCGLVYQSPHMTEAESVPFYAEEYRLLQEGNSDPTARNVTTQKARASSLQKFIQPVLPTIHRHLDIGCSLGILMQHFQGVYHNQTVGVEPGEAHRAQATREGLKVYPSLDELEQAGEVRFDLVSMTHVLEHLPDPVGYLTHLRERVLTPAGRLLVEVPNLYAHDSFEVAHLIAFSPHTLHEVLLKGGFEIIKFQKHGRPNSNLLPLFLTALCRPFHQPIPRPVRPERWVSFKRKRGMIWRAILSRLFPKRAWVVQVDPGRREEVIASDWRTERR